MEPDEWGDGLVVLSAASAVSFPGTASTSTCMGPKLYDLVLLWELNEFLPSTRNDASHRVSAS